MKKSLIVLSSLCLVLTACDNKHPDGRPAPDNTARNAEPQLTSGDQLENEVDRMLSQKVREAVVADSALSTNAKNIKIITRDGVVTLRGVVNSENEKAEVVKKAQSVSGIKTINDQLEIVRS